MGRDIAKILLAVAALGAGGAAAQVQAPPDTPERAGSPYDRNPVCANREVSGTDPACVINDGPSQYRPRYRRKPEPATVAPQVPSAPLPQGQGSTAASGVAVPFPGGVGSASQSQTK